MKESPTKLVLGLTAMVAILAAIIALFGVRYGALFGAYLAYEFWTLYNKYPGDTISEIVWKFRKRSILPLMVGLSAGVAIALGWLGAPTAVGRGLLLGGLLAHFFWPPEQSEQPEKEEA